MRATTRRSHQMLKSVSSTRTTKISTALTMMSHTGSLPKADRVSAAMGSIWLIAALIIGHLLPARLRK